MVSFVLGHDSSTLNFRNEQMVVKAVKDIIEVESRIYQIDQNPPDDTLASYTIADLNTLAPFVRSAIPIPYKHKPHFYYDYNILFVIAI